MRAEGEMNAACGVDAKADGLMRVMGLAIVGQSDALRRSLRQLLPDHYDVAGLIEERGMAQSAAGQHRVLAERHAIDAVTRPRRPEFQMSGCAKGFWSDRSPDP